MRIQFWVGQQWPMWQRMSFKEICSRDCEVDAQSIHWWGIAWRFDNLSWAYGILWRQRKHCIASSCWTTTEHSHSGDGEYSRSCSSRLSHHCSNNLLKPQMFKKHLSIRFCERSWKFGVTACWVPHFLTREQRDHCTEICQEWLKRIEARMNQMWWVV